ncbi:MAG: hypothetical protein ACQERS_13035 [Bacteroidota bacterium]
MNGQSNIRIFNPTFQIFFVNFWLMLLLWNGGTEDPEFAIAGEGDELVKSPRHGSGEPRQRDESIMEWWNTGFSAGVDLTHHPPLFTLAFSKLKIANANSGSQVPSLST